MQKPKSMKRKAKGTDTMAHGDGAKVIKSFMPYCRATKMTTKKPAESSQGHEGGASKKGSGQKTCGKSRR